MRRTRLVAAESRAAILERASRLFRERGIGKTSVGDVMAEAGFTHGGFYRHFEDKDALVAEAVGAAFDEIKKAVEDRGAAVGAKAAVADYFAHYLSDDHLAHPELGCPVPALAGDISRGPETLKAAFGAGFNRSLVALAEGLSGTEAARREQAIRELAMRVGAILIARASDAETAKDVLAACRGSEA